MTSSAYNVAQDLKNLPTLFTDPMKYAKESTPAQILNATRGYLGFGKKKVTSKRGKGAFTNNQGQMVIL